ncbi:hypothetical protein DL765_003943 [Monosporascus sp. GIB2]|nr:hypothetical protein DL765_003943 [Monosporascus sp. GIB2]
MPMNTPRYMLLLAGFLSFLPFSLAQRTPYENLVLADCGIGLGVNGGSTSREIIYYSGDAGGVSATLPNGDTFSVYINPSIKDPNAAGEAWHRFEMDKPLKCYSYHWDKVYQLDDGKWCSSAYVCNHRGTPYVKPNNSGGGGGGGGNTCEDL